MTTSTVHCQAELGSVGRAAEARQRCDAQLLTFRVGAQ